MLEVTVSLVLSFALFRCLPVLDSERQDVARKVHVECQEEEVTEMIEHLHEKVPPQAQIGGQVRHEQAANIKKERDQWSVADTCWLSSTYIAPYTCSVHSQP